MGCKQEQSHYDTSGVLSITPDGNLVLYNNHDREFPLWSTNISLEGTVDCVAQPLDLGNLILVQNDESKRIFWQKLRLSHRYHASRSETWVEQENWTRTVVLSVMEISG